MEVRPSVLKLPYTYLYHPAALLLPPSRARLAIASFFAFLGLISRPFPLPHHHLLNTEHSRHHSPLPAAPRVSALILALQQLDHTLLL